MSRDSEDRAELAELREVLEHALTGGSEPPHADSGFASVQQLHALLNGARDGGRVFSYLSTMSHELRTPLNAVIGYSELVLDELELYDPTALRRDVTRIQHAGRHLLGLIDEVVDVARLESGASTSPRTTFETGVVVERCLPAFGKLMAARDNQLEWSIEPGVRVRADAARFEGIVRMLVNRASRVTRGGKVGLVVAQRGEDAVVEVSDTGSRIPTEDLARSFLPFEEGSSSGISAAFRVAQLLGGRLSAHSSPEGSTFRLSLPALDLPSDDADPLPAAAPGEQVVLVIDDDPTSHDLIARHLTDAACRVLSAYSGPEALRLVEAITPDVIALEVVLPDMDGWEVLARLKSRPQLASVPVVMMSMLPDVGGHAVGLGADGFVAKPFDRGAMLDQVTALVGDGRRRVLVVDDEADARELVRRTLLPLGHLVDEVPDGEAALAYLQRQRPDLILLDLMMPEMDGFEVVRELQSDPELAQIPLLVLTGMTLSAADRRRLASAQVVQKGAGHQVVLENIDAALLRSRQPSPAPR